MQSRCENLPFVNRVKLRSDEGSAFFYFLSLSQYKLYDVCINIIIVIKKVMNPDIINDDGVINVRLFIPTLFRPAQAQK